LSVTTSADIYFSFIALTSSILKFDSNQKVHRHRSHSETDRRKMPASATPDRT